jgi:uncharacterized protein (TIGR02001 family)
LSKGRSFFQAPKKKDRASTSSARTGIGRSIFGLHGSGTAARLLAGCALILAAAAAPPAHAQVSANIGFETDYRFRGRTISDGKPVVTADIDYDDRSGFYLGGSMTASVTGSDPGVLNVQGDAGYARRVSPSLTIDLGIVRSQYTAKVHGTPFHYTEFYAGLSSHGVSARLYYSPDYLAPGVGTLYGELEFAVSPLKHWQLSAHAGKLAFVANRPVFASPSGSYDWRVGVARQFGRFTLTASLTGGGPGQEYYDGDYHDRTAVVGGISFAF